VVAQAAIQPSRFLTEVLAISPPEWSMPHSITNCAPLAAYVYIVLFEAGQDRGEAVLAGAVDDALETADEPLLFGDPPDILTAEMVLLPEAV